MTVDKAIELSKKYLDGLWSIILKKEGVNCVCDLPKEKYDNYINLVKEKMKILYCNYYKLIDSVEEQKSFHHSWICLYHGFDTNWDFEYKYKVIR